MRGLTARRSESSSPGPVAVGLQTAADLNPLKYVVEAERALFAGTFPVDTVAYGFLGAGAVAALGLLVGLRAMERSS